MVSCTVLYKELSAKVLDPESDPATNGTCAQFLSGSGVNSTSVHLTFCLHQILIILRSKNDFKFHPSTQPLA